MEKKTPLGFWTDYILEFYTFNFSAKAIVAYNVLVKSELFSDVLYKLQVSTWQMPVILNYVPVSKAVQNLGRIFFRMSS